MDKFVKDVIKNLESVNVKAYSDKEATKVLKKVLIDLAKNYKYNVNPDIGKRKDKNREWLYDIIIYSLNKDCILNEVYLVGESEWKRNYDEIKYDFEKLLFVRSKVHLMIYQVSIQKYTEYKNNLIKIIKKSKSCLKGDLYLFAIYNRNTKVFKVEQYIKK